MWKVLWSSANSDIWRALLRVKFPITRQTGEWKKVASARILMIRHTRWHIYTKLSLIAYHIQIGKCLHTQIVCIATNELFNTFLLLQWLFQNSESSFHLVASAHWIFRPFKCAPVRKTSQKHICEKFLLYFDLFGSVGFFSLSPIVSVRFLIVIATFVDSTQKHMKIKAKVNEV